MDAWKERIAAALGQSHSHETAFTSILASARDLGFEYCAYGIRQALPIANPKTFMVNNYPEKWQQRYADSGYLAVDPTAIHGRRSQTPIVWSDAVFLTAQEMWTEAQSFDLKYGIAQSTFGDNRSISMLTLSRSATPLTRSELDEKGPHIRWLADLAHGELSETFTSPESALLQLSDLTPREIEVLKWMADGKTANDTADILSVSTATINFHVKNATAKLNAPNKTCAIVKAVTLGLLA